MFNKVFALSMAVGIAGTILLPAQAQNFVSRGRAVRTQHTTVVAPQSGFEARFSQFQKDLGQTAAQMKIDHDYVESNVAQRHEAQAVTNQLDTVNSSQSGFNNSQNQALNSGGLYNTPVRTNIGLWGDPYYRF